MWIYVTNLEREQMNLKGMKAEEGLVKGEGISKGRASEYVRELVRAKDKVCMKVPQRSSLLGVLVWKKKA